MRPGKAFFNLRACLYAVALVEYVVLLPTLVAKMSLNLI